MKLEGWWRQKQVEGEMTASEEFLRLSSRLQWTGPVAVGVVWESQLHSAVSAVAAAAGVCAVFVGGLGSVGESPAAVGPGPGCVLSWLVVVVGGVAADWLERQGSRGLGVGRESGMLQDQMVVALVLSVAVGRGLSVTTCPIFTHIIHNCSYICTCE